MGGGQHVEEYSVYQVHLTSLVCFCAGGLSHDCRARKGAFSSECAFLDHADVVQPIAMRASIYQLPSRHFKSVSPFASQGATVQRQT
jgi:hypothetical protein